MNCVKQGQSAFVTAGSYWGWLCLLIGSDAPQTITHADDDSVGDGPHTAGTRLVWVSGGPLGEGGDNPGKIGCPAVTAHPIYMRHAGTTRSVLQDAALDDFRADLVIG